MYYAIRCCTLIGALLLGGGVASAAPNNVVLFVTDDQSKDAGCYGNPMNHTPSLDALAADGVRFDRAFCTTASCSASRSVILTGIYNHANGHYGHEHSYHHFSAFDRVESLPVLLRKAGYRTARVGKFHVAPERVFAFDEVIRGNSRNAVQMADNCREWISAEEDRPFFLYFCTSDPHRGGRPGPGEFAPNPFGNRPDGYPGVDEVEFDPEEVTVHEFLPDTPVCRAELAEYYQSCARIDQGLGRLVSHLKEAGVYDDTMIIFTSDHGIAFPGGKTTLYQGGMEVPFVVRAPEMKNRGGSTDIMVNHADLTPTILDFAGALPKESNIQGRSWLQAYQQDQVDGWDEIYASHTFHEITMYYPMRVARSGNYKLIWNIAHDLPYPFASDLWAAPTWQERYQKGPDTMYGPRTVEDYVHRPEFELYDLKSDPLEKKNLAGVDQYAGTLSELKDKIKAFQKRTNDPWELKWRYE